MISSGQKSFIIFLMSMLIFGLFSCGEDKPTQPPDDKPKDTLKAPVISSISPSDSAKVGDEVTITGNYFGSSREQSTVSFNGTPVEASSGYKTWSNTSLKVLVPDGASSGNIIVKVNDSLSNGKYLKIYIKSTDTVDNFKIISIDKDSGYSKTTLVTINGIGFGNEQSDSYVSFNGTKADNYLNWKNDKITVYVPNNATSGNISVNVGGKTTNGVFFKVLGGQTDDTPQINSLAPSKQKAGGQVTLSGKNFGSSRGDGNVYFGNTPADVYPSWRDDQIIVEVPSGAQTGKIKVYANKKYSNEVDFTLDIPSGAPVIDYLDANKAYIGKNLGIYGKNFGASQGSSKVTINKTEVITYKSWTDEKIIIIVPEGASSGNVVVTVNGVESNGVSVTVPEPDYVVERVLIPKGSFIMGPFIDDMGEAPAHTVNITFDFYMTPTEITQETWELVMNKSNPSYDKSSKKKPVEQMRWDQTMVFCNRLSKLEGLDSCYKWDGEKVICDFTKNGWRLPTEAEWEYACRAGSTIDPEPIGDYAWTQENAGSATQEVKQKKPNGWGLYDMLGNVYEWCWDEYSPFYYASSPANDPKGPNDDTGSKVIRGGNCLNIATKATSRYRESQGAPTTDPRTGFRVVRKK